jgi:hypothetical protein
MVGVDVALYNPWWIWITAINLDMGSDFVNNEYSRVGFFGNGRGLLDTTSVFATPAE